MKRAVLIQHDGSVRPVAIPVHEDVDELALMQQYVGGYIEKAPVNLPNLTAFYDEEGRQKGRPVNALASALFLLGPGQFPIVGDVLVMGGVTEDGDTLGLTVEQVNIFLSPAGEDILNALAEVNDELRDAGVPD